ncbi:sel1 repeat family protein [Solihabitans fulvus]|uniref:Sel1 repeat family protein n=1 Tax=Solihabitans fulvus TaxID=1892852 RepID=A0A5B2WT72_9PSEU|nr:sel1 repeat family protein [Solihabitans fulvus]KAA2254030.1 sel1 repeat family protein [Solihabitans fulvus]
MDGSNELDAPALRRLAELVHRGTGDEDGDAELAQRLVRLADTGEAHQLDLNTLLRLPDLVYRGADDEVGDPDLAERPLRLAAATGDVRAVESLGSFLLWAQDDGEAARPWLLRGAELGDGNAMANLGDMSDFEEDEEQAELWYARAVEAGNERAGAELAALRELRERRES